MSNTTIHKLSSQEMPFPSARKPENMAHRVMQQMINPELTKHTAHPDAVEHLVSNPVPAITGLLPCAQSTSVSLPSRFSYYPFKQLYIKPLGTLQIAKLNRGAHEDSYLPLLEVMETCVSTVEGFSTPACWLSIADFYYLLYWLRFESFPKNDKLLHTSICSNPEHIKRIRAGEEGWDVNTLEVKIRVDRSELEIIELEQKPDPEHYKLNTPNWYMRPPTMFDFVQFMSKPEWLQDSEIHYLAMLAMMLEYDDPAVPMAEKRAKSFEEKIEFVKTLTAAEDDLIREFEVLVSGFGVQEKINVTCKRCGASWEDYVSVDALSFLPQNR